jgi:integrative and conjugative element protein (TIGR02256 family)
MLDIVLAKIPLRLVVHDSVIENLKAFRQLNEADIEACGILLGKVYEGAIEITGFTPPQPSDMRRRTGYTRQCKGHLQAAMWVWEQSGGLEGYVGEWHTHPANKSTPSSKDYAEIAKISRINLNNVVSLILGRHEGCIFASNDKILTDPVSFPL